MTCPPNPFTAEYDNLVPLHHPYPPPELWESGKRVLQRFPRLQRQCDNENAHAKDTDKATRDTTPVNEPISAEALCQHLHGKPSGTTY